ncbi:MAG: hypothetical protein CMD19_07580, partial [Flavobacteriales bacterium]|nr:hypothetical protein [Flavobacteriales bacterium]
MKLINYLLAVLIFISSCKESEVDSPIFDENYGEGMYIISDIGVSFYNYQDSLPQVINQIYKTVNNITVDNPKKIKFRDSRAYILAENHIIITDVNTFQEKGIVANFLNPVDFDFVSNDRLFVVDKDDSKVKVVDINRMEITSDIETGDNTKPVFVLSKWYRSYIMNGGTVADSLKDSTIVAIDYKDELVPLADMMGSLYVGDNPNSAVNINNLKVLCRGIYDPNDLTTQTQSSLVTVNPWDVVVTASTVLSGIYNASNLISNNEDTEYYFLAEGGFYRMNANGSGVSRINSLISDILYYRDEIYSQYSVTDSVTYYYNRDVLYVNDSENS